MYWWQCLNVMQYTRSEVSLSAKYLYKMYTYLTWVELWRLQILLSKQQVFLELETVLQDLLQWWCFVHLAERFCNCTHKNEYAFYTPCIQFHIHCKYQVVVHDKLSPGPLPRRLRNTLYIYLKSNHLHLHAVPWRFFKRGPKLCAWRNPRGRFCCTHSFSKLVYKHRIMDFCLSPAVDIQKNKMPHKAVFKVWVSVWVIRNCNLSAIQFA